LFFAGFIALGVHDGAGGAGHTSGMLAVVLAGAMLGFLRYNWPPARIFMGDSGSLFVGAALGGLAVAGLRSGSGTPFVTSVLVVWPFVWDATYTIAWRAIHRQAMRPHRTHLYQRLVLAGCRRSAVTGAYFGLTVLSGTAALLYPRIGAPGQAALLTGALATGTGLVLVTRHFERRRRDSP
jgi:UDP-GlcNAc:undecaprenyl-phosphate GlcNAc-1-phosphate transferase